MRTSLFYNLIAKLINKTLAQGQSSYRDGYPARHGVCIETDERTFSPIGFAISDENYSYDDNRPESVIKSVEKTAKLLLSRTQVDQLFTLESCHDDASIYHAEFAASFISLVNSRLPAYSNFKLTF